MPLVYADTSALFAYFYPRDAFAIAVTEAVHKVSPDFAYWEFSRFELRHNLRQLRDDRYSQIAWHAFRAAESTAARLRWQSELSANRAFDSAEELSAEKAAKHRCGSSDFIHVAAARRLKLLATLNEFWTCDSEQAGLAKAVGLKTRLFKI